MTPPRYRLAFHSLLCDGPVQLPRLYRRRWTARFACWWLQRTAGRGVRWFYVTTP